MASRNGIEDTQCLTRAENTQCLTRAQCSMASNGITISQRNSLPDLTERTTGSPCSMA